MGALRGAVGLLVEMTFLVNKAYQWKADAVSLCFLLVILVFKMALRAKVLSIVPRARRLGCACCRKYMLDKLCLGRS